MSYVNVMRASKYINRGCDSSYDQYVMDGDQLTYLEKLSSLKSLINAEPEGDSTILEPGWIIRIGDKVNFCLSLVKISRGECKTNSLITKCRGVT